MTHRITTGLRYLAEQHSCTREEFRRDNAPQGDMLLDGLVSQGYTATKGDRFALSMAGRRRLEHEDPVEEAEVA